MIPWRSSTSPCYRAKSGHEHILRHTVILYQLARTTFHDDDRDCGILLRLRALVVGGQASRSSVIVPLPSWSWKVSVRDMSGNST